jgi:uncharacterized membrane protein (UPF0127 family)
VSRASAALLGALALVACDGARPSTPAPAPAVPQVEATSRVYFSTPGGEVVVQVEVADTPAAHARGLMFRKTLARDRGMLFLFEGEEDHSFWMKNTYLPLDLIFVSQGLEVVGVVEGAEPLTESPRTVGKPSRYVVEVNAGFARERGIGPGTRMRLELASRRAPPI